MKHAFDAKDVVLVWLSLFGKNINKQLKTQNTHKNFHLYIISQPKSKKTI
jgi:hypothetical protein